MKKNALSEAYSSSSCPFVLTLNSTPLSFLIFVHSARVCQAKPCPSSLCQPQCYQPVCAIYQQRWCQWQARALQHPAAAISSTTLPTSRGATTFSPARAKAATEERTTLACWKPCCCIAILNQPYCPVLTQPDTPRSAASPLNSSNILSHSLGTHALRAL